MSDVAPKSEVERFLTEAGWTAWLLGFVFANFTVVGILSAFGDGPGQLDLEGVELFWQIFWVTVPLTIAATIFCGMAFAGVMQSGWALAAGGIGALVAGAAIGNALGDATGLAAADFVSRTYPYPGSGPPGMAARALQWLSVYYAIYGWQYFIGALALGGLFGRWAARISQRQS